MFKRNPQWKQALLKISLCFGILMIGTGQHLISAEAHASLIKSDPAPESHLIRSPSQITLTFNERLEKELYYIKLFNTKGITMVKEQAVMSKDQHKLMLKLPLLSPGIYTVSYHVISADGHPVGASYPIIIGDVSQKNSAANVVEKTPSHGHGGISFLLIHSVYYFALLTVIGFLFWFNILKRKGIRMPDDFSFWFNSMTRLFVLLTAGINYLNLSQAIGDVSWANFVILLFKTTTGLTAICLIVLAVLAMFILRKWLWADSLWIIFVSISEAVSGHAAAFSPVLYTVMLDTVHVLTAGIWTGGLIYIAIYRSNEREHIWRFIPIFSKVALISLLALILTGSLSVLSFLPALKDLFLSSWGILLLVKIGIVILIIPVGASLRHFFKEQRQVSFFKLHNIDIVLLISILLIVGALTYLSPLPENQPFHYAANSSGVRTTIDIQPRNPGTKNVFTVNYTGYKKSPQDVKMFLIYQDDKQLSPIEIPLKKEKTDSVHHIYSYYASGLFISIPGEYKVQVRTLDTNDNETVTEKNMNVYPSYIRK